MKLLKIEKVWLLPPEKRSGGYRLIGQYNNGNLGRVGWKLKGLFNTHEDWDWSECVLLCDYYLEAEEIVKKALEKTDIEFAGCVE